MSALNRFVNSGGLEFNTERKEWSSHGNGLGHSVLLNRLFGLFKGERCDMIRSVAKWGRRKERQLMMPDEIIFRNEFYAGYD